MEYGIGSYIKPVLNVVPSIFTIEAEATTATISATGGAIDRIDYRSCNILTAISLAEDSTLDLTITLQDSNDLSTWTSVASEDLNDAEGSLLIDFSVDLKGCKRYIRVVLSGTLTGVEADTAIISTIIILGEAVIKPC